MDHQAVLLARAEERLIRESAQRAQHTLLLDPREQRFPRLGNPIPVMIALLAALRMWIGVHPARALGRLRRQVI